MSKIRKPAIPSPRIPKIKKPSISKRNRLGAKISSVPVKKTGIKAKIMNKPLVKKKTTSKRNTGTCYAQLGCRHVLEKEVTKARCKQMGGKSWRKSGSACEKLAD
ncbi:hypothetical protein [Nitrosopumilus sp.]|uniref:hypothetical protein n=1 Tax=Nitrosopumilus sp. TaxID=2024843 RepID=UPI003B5B60C2